MAEFSSPVVSLGQRAPEGAAEIERKFTPLFFVEEAAELHPAPVRT